MTPKWYEVAVPEIGVKEVIGVRHNPRILEYHSKTGLKAQTDEVPWCGSFVAWCMDQAGIDYSSIRARAAGARQWLDWGVEVPKDKVTVGAVVILRRGDPPAGHVGLFAGWVNEEKTRLRILGGNQSNAVTIAEYPVTQVIGFRWPKEVKAPVAEQPLSQSGVIRGAGGAIVVVAAEEVSRSGPEIVQSLQDADDSLSQGTIISMIIAAFIIMLLVMVIVSRIRGTLNEKKIGKGIEYGTGN